MSAHTSPTPSTQDSAFDDDIDRYLAEDSATLPNGQDIHSESEGSDWNTPFTQAPGSDSPSTGPPDVDDTHSIATPSQQRGIITEATRIAHRLKLHPYQVSRVKPFVTSSRNSQLVETFCEVLALGNKMDQIISEQPRFSVDMALAKTIKSYALGVLLSNKLRAYKGTLPINLVYAVILKQQVNLPANLSKSPFAQEVIKSHIGAELTQLRCSIKKAVIESIEKQWSIYQLASKVIKGSPCKIYISLCARLAVMRKVYINIQDPESTNFWDAMDTCLEHYRTRGNNNVNAIRKILAGTLLDDRKKYGVDNTYHIPEEGGEFELSIEDNM